jgi:competence CoiA-like predicted nuclease
LQKILPAGETILEKPFPTINRIGDLVWEPRKIIFEIQCSNISSFETQQRIRDYLKAGYQVVWILDDRIFNRRIVRPAEKSMRQTTCYFATIRGLQFPIFYDQFEIFSQEKRIKKGQRLKIQINKPCPMPEISWDKEVIPQQVWQKIHKQPFYFQGDLLHKALLSHAVPALAASMQNIRLIELFYAENTPNEGLLARIMARCLWEPLGYLMHVLQETNERWG